MCVYVNIYTFSCEKCEKNENRKKKTPSYDTYICNGINVFIGCILQFKKNFIDFKEIRQLKMN